MINHELLRFAKTISSKYTNKDQSIANPRHFSHINIYFRPLNWSIFNAPSFYSEQSFDYDPWSPYRQAIHKLIEQEGLFIMQNYALLNAKRVAGYGFNPEVLNDPSQINSKARGGCSMQFKQISTGKYIGRVEPGRKCLIPRDNRITYLKSKVEFDEESWTCIDQGFDIYTNEYIWGSENGPLRFKRVEDLGDEIERSWKLL